MTANRLSPALAKGRYLGFALAVVLLLASLAGTASAESSVPDALRVAKSAASHEQVAAYIQYRKLVGFRSDPAYVEKLASVASTDLTFGMPLTLAEYKEMVRRSTVAESIGRLNLDLSSEPTFGGAWIDQLDGGVAKFLFTSTPGASIVTKIRAVMGPVNGFELTPALRLICNASWSTK